MIRIRPSMKAKAVGPLHSLNYFHAAGLLGQYHFHEFRTY